ncbi:MAG: TraB/GumN family protein [Psychroflexus maritimus]
MNIKFKITSLFILLGSILFAQNLENSLLWKIEDPQQEKTSYLFGTMHAGCELELGNQLKETLMNSELLLLEINLNDPGVNQEMASQMFMGKGRNLGDLMSKEDYDLVLNFLHPRLAKQGLDLEFIKKIKPIYLSVMLIPSLFDCDQVTAYDLLLAKFAQQIGIDQAGLETVEDQLRVFESIPLKKQAQMLVGSARDDGKSDQKQMLAMAHAYQERDLNRLSEIANEDKGLFIEYEDEILIKRNKNWIPIIKKQMTEYNTFIGVGAMHLVGEQGLINLLRKEGYEVTAMN